MSKKLSREKRGISINPSESNRNTESAENTKLKEDTKEGTFRNVQTPEDNKNNLEDDEETRVENQISKKEN